jgi:hypothetical protein
MSTICWPKSTFFAQKAPYSDGIRTIMGNDLYRQRIMVLWVTIRSQMCSKFYY